MTAALAPVSPSPTNPTRYVLHAVAPCSPWCAEQGHNGQLAADAGCVSEPRALVTDRGEIGLIATRSLDGDPVITVDVLDDHGRVAELSVVLRDARALAMQLLDLTDVVMDVGEPLIIPSPPR